MPQIRPAILHDAQAIAHIHVSAWQLAYWGILPNEFLDNLSLEDRTKRWEEILGQSDQFAFVAKVDGKVVGFANGGPEREKGFLMTLLIGTVSNKHIVLTSDHRRTVEEKGVISRFDDLRKIFIVIRRPLAIAHHGENIFAIEDELIPLGSYLPMFISENSDIFDRASISSICCLFRERLKPIAVRTLKIRGKHLMGFWIAGFAQCTTKPELYEICWYKDGSCKMEKNGNLIIGGDVQEHLPPNVRDYLDGSYNIDMIPKASVERARRYHNKLFELALQKEHEPRRFSNEKDQLLIDREGCHWITLPSIQDLKGKEQ